MFTLKAATIGFTLKVSSNIQPATINIPGRKVDHTTMGLTGGHLTPADASTRRNKPRRGPELKEQKPTASALRVIVLKSLMPWSRLLHYK